MAVTAITSVGLAIRVKKYGRSNPVNINRGNNKGVIIGKTVEQGVPVSRRVMCHVRDTGVLVNTTWSNANGDYVFKGLDNTKKYYVVSLDEDMSETQYNAVVQDLIPASEVIP